MIYCFKRNQLDIQKYDACIEAAYNSRIYAYSWYLDSVADNWDALILNDYEAVMPLPWRRKYFIKYIYPPAWTQQLGIFSKHHISEELIHKFIKAIPRKFKKVTIQFNSENKFQHKNITERINYILPLDKPYDEIYKGYRKDRKKRLKEGRVFSPDIIEETNFEKLKESFKINYKSKINIKETDFDKLGCLISEGFKKGVVTFTSVLNNEGKLISSLVLLKESGRIVVLFSSTNSQGLKENTFSCLIDEAINNHENTSLLIDFEGSNIKSIASFNKSFGAKIEKYFLYKHVNLPF